MNPHTNPFSPGTGNQPPELAGRSELLNKVEVLLARDEAGRSEQSMLLVGLRGLSVLSSFVSAIKVKLGDANFV